jgi:hypothetical protein
MLKQKTYKLKTLVKTEPFINQTLVKSEPFINRTLNKLIIFYLLFNLYKANTWLYCTQKLATMRFMPPFFFTKAPPLFYQKIPTTLPKWLHFFQKKIIWPKHPHIYKNQGFTKLVPLVDSITATSITSSSIMYF